MKKRPVLAVWALPVLPMAEPTAATSGSLATTVPSLTIIRAISCGETSCADFGEAGDEAGVLGREEALGDDHVEMDGERQGGEEHHQRQELVPEHDVEGAPVEAVHAIEHGLDGVVDAAVLPAVMVEEARAEHRRQRERHEGRDGNCRRDGDGELAEQPPDDAAHQQQRNEHGDQREADRQHGEADLARAGERRLERRHAILDVTIDVLHHHDGVVDDEAHRDGERHQREIVEAEAGQIHDRGGAEQRQRHDQARYDGDAQIAQEQEDDEDHEGDGDAEGELDVLDRSADRLGPVRQDDRR